MPTYRRMKMAQLRDICNERGIEVEQYKYKREFVTALEQYDLQNANVSDNSDNSGNATDVEDDILHERDVVDFDNEIRGGHGGDNIIADTDSRGVGVESETVTELRLRLALAREERLMQEQAWNIEQQRAGMTNGVSIDHNALNMGVKDIKSLLPTLCDTDVLSFFLTYERVLTINDVDVSLWSRLLPGQLSPRALKTFSRLSIEETQDYQKIKSAILTAYKLDAASYLSTFRNMRRTGQMSYRNLLENLKDVMFRH